jgi:hypothetical protein
MTELNRASASPAQELVTARRVTPGPFGRLERVEDLSCRGLVELVTDYLDGALAPEERARFQAHVAGCPGCDRYLEQIRATIALAGASAELDRSPEVSGLLAAFRDWHRGAR